MTRIIRSLAFLSLVVSGAANATLISFDPADTAVDLGGSFSIDILATPEAGELIGTYDFLVNYDPTILAFDSLVFGTSLNSSASFCDLLGTSCRDYSDTGGALNLFEVSFEFDLAALQDGITSIVLATLTFDAIGLGTSGLSFTGNIAGLAAPFNFLGDALGLPLAVVPGVGSATVAPTQVSEPPVILLMLTGILALFGGKRREGKASGK